MNSESGQARDPAERISSQREPSHNILSTRVSRESSDSLDGLLHEQYYDACEDTEQIDALGQEQDPVQSESPALTEHVDYCQTWYHKVTWFFYIIAANNSILVTVVYWSLLYSGFRIHEADVAFHLMNSVFMLIETCISSIPVRLFHVVYAELYGVTYLVFSVVYWRSGGTGSSGEHYIYPILNYEDEPYAAAVLIILYGLVGLPAAQLLNFGLFTLRCYLHRLRSSR